MKVHELQVAKHKNRKRVGRGIAAGQGKTAGRGTKGQNARSGGGVRVGFEGGQNPLAKRLPKKRGFRSLNPTNYQVVNLMSLDQFKAGAKVDAVVLAAAGLVKRADRDIKLLGQGEVTKKLAIEVQAASTSAKDKIGAVGGTIKLVELPKKKKVSTKPVKTT